jgi:HlyD family secretion protein
VVTYTVEILTDNTDLRLLPYLTANVKFIVGSHENVLAVPNAAVRWSPSTGPAASAATTSPAGTSGSGPAPGRGGGSGRAGNGNVSGAGGIAGGGVAGAASRPVGSGSGRERQAGVIWLLVDGTPQAISVRTGLTDGVLTEIEPLGGAELPEGALVIVGEENPQTRSASTSSTGAGGSPFTPQMPGRGGGRR